VSQQGEGHGSEPGAPPGVPGVMTFGPSAAGELFAERYRLEEHVDTDAAGRQIWRGVDVVLKRPVAVVIRQPGGESAAAMLTTAVAASRLVHPHLVSVYDAIDDGHRAYLVREWVPGIALRDVLRQGPLDPERSTLVTHAIAEAISALHSAGIVHGNVHPGTILIADDGRVVLTDAHADGPADPESDVRAVGAVLYASLTGYWPHAEAGYSSLPDAVRDNAGRLATPRQVRGGIPNHLDAISADLLDPALEPPAASMLAAEFARLATVGDVETGYNSGYRSEYDDEELDGGPMGFGAGEHIRRRAGGKLALGIIVLTVIAIVLAIIGAKVLGGSSPSGSTAPGPGPVNSSAPTVGGGQPIALTADQIRVVDPPGGDRTELAGAEKAIDGKDTTGWGTQGYSQPKFGNLKPGMGLLINLGAPKKVGAVKVVVNLQGATMSLRTGPNDPGNTSDGDKAIADSYTIVGQELADQAGTVLVFPVPKEKQTMQYLLVWITRLPLDPAKNRYSISVNEITVLAP
jgi:tRNA A-37 threonylcarbamoyl transferase component Bud32